MHPPQGGERRFVWWSPGYAKTCWGLICHAKPACKAVCSAENSLLIDLDSKFDTLRLIQVHTKLF